MTVSVVRYTNGLGRDRKGVCSTYLADSADDGPAQVYVQRSPHFRPPAGSTTPMIMIGPGTGVAPFIGFLEDRRAKGHTGPNWLFFGEQHGATDFYYREDLEDFVASGHLEGLAAHTRAALRNGMTPAEIKEVLLQTAVYCGIPAAGAAFSVAQSVIQEETTPPA